MARTPAAPDVRHGLEACDRARFGATLVLCILSAIGPIAAWAQPPPTIVNVARASGLDAQGHALEASGRAETPIELVVRLEVSPGQEGSLRAGTDIEYEHWIFNRGSAAESIDVAVRGTSWPAELAPSGSASLRLGPVAAGDSIAVSALVHCPAGARPGDQETTRLTATLVRVPEETHTVTDRTVVEEPRLDPLLLSVEPQGTVLPGSTLLYRLRIGNPDPDFALESLVVEDSLPSTLLQPLRFTTDQLQDGEVPGRAVPLRAAYDAGSQRVSWTVTNLPAGFLGELQLTVRVADGAPEGLRLVNRVVAHAVGLPRAQSNAVTVTVVPPLLQLEVTALTPSIEAGDAVVYAVSLGNLSGANALTNAGVSFQLPSGFRFLDSGSLAAGKPIPGAPGTGGVALLRADSLGPGDRFAWTLACAASERSKTGVYLAVASAHAALRGDVALEAISEAPVRIVARPGLEGTILGRVYVDEDSSGAPGEFEGLPHVRVLLEDGTQSWSDARGRFHIEGVRPGLHVLRLDDQELSGDLVFESAGRRAAGSPRTRFVDLGPGEIVKVNFAARFAPRALPRRYEVAIGHETWRFYEFSLFGVEADGTEGVDLSPEGARLLAGLRAAATSLPDGSEDAATADPGAGVNAGPGIETDAFGGDTAARGSDAPAGLAPALSALRQALGTTRGGGDGDSLRARVRLFDEPLTGLGREDSARQRALEAALGIAARTSEDAAPPAPAPPLEERVRLMTSEAAIVEPENDRVLPGERAAIVVKFPLGEVARLRVNGNEVSEALVGTRITAPAQGLACWRYVGVPLRPGANTLVLESCRDSSCTRAISRLIRIGAPARLVLEPAATPADGTSKARLTIRALDAGGHVVPEAALVTLDAEGGVLGRDADAQQPGFQVRLQGGLAEVRLPAAARACERHVRARLADVSAETTVQLQATPHAWLIAGVGEVSIAARPRGQELTADERVAGADIRSGVYAQGRVGPQGVLTVGLDTERDRDQGALFGERALEGLLPALGDAAAHAATAPSSWPAYARLDLPGAHAQVGDFRAGWDDAHLGQFDRALTGFDGAWSSRRGTARLQGFAAATRQNAVHEEIAGRGVAGPYVLRRRPIVVRSERVTIETRDRRHPEQVLQARVLVRQAEYSLDYATGSLLLKEPLPSADPSWNPVQLVVQYETIEDRAETPVYGGRAVVSPVSRLRTGLLGVRETGATGARTLVGGDATWSLAPDLALGCEYAHSRGLETGAAFQTTLQGSVRGVRLGRLYYRDLSPGFQNDSRHGETETGTRRFGLESRAALGAHGTLALDAFQQEDRVRGLRRHEVAAEYGRDFGPWQGSCGYKLAGQRNAADARLAHLLGLRARRQLGRFGLEAGYQQALGAAPDTDPTRLSLGADLRLTSRLGLRLRQEWDGSGTGRGATLVGLESRLTDATALTSRYERLSSLSGERASTHVGLRTAVPLSAAWSVSASAEQGRVLTETGQSSTSLSLGAEWRVPRRLVSMQYEGSSGAGLSLHAVRLGTSLQIGEAWTVLARERWLGARSGSPWASGNDLWLGWAYRPVRGDALQCLASVRSLLNPSPGAVQGVSISRTVIALESSAEVARRWTLGAGCGARLAAASAAGTAARSTTVLPHLRLTYEASDRVDVGIAARLRARSSARSDWSSGVETGVRLRTDLRAVAGYNFLGFTDLDLPSDQHGGKAGYLALQFKFDEGLLGRGDRP